MSIASSATTTAAMHDGTIAPKRGLVRIYVELTKARLSALVVMTTAVGFIIAPAGPIDWFALAMTATGTALAAAAASLLNQILEIGRDAKMLRTRDRPLPSGEISPMHGYVAAIVCAHAGVTILGVFANLLAAALAAGTIVIYVLLYTPLKVRSTLNTLVGAVCGAVPPMIGWAAATGTLDTGAWILGAILFVWQLPHFLALAWLYRADYERGGFAMLPVVDRSGALTSRIVLLTSLILIPLGLMVTLAGVAGWWFAAGSVLLAAWMIGLAVRLFIDHSDANARRLFLASITYMMLLMSLLVLDRGPARPADEATMIAEKTADVATASLLPRLPGP